jgi:hypothetical protein
MMSFLTYITGFLMNFELLPILTDYAFPIGFYVKLSSAVGAILIEGPNRRTHFWKRTIQWLFHENFVLIEQMVSELLPILTDYAN